MGYAHDGLHLLSAGDVHDYGVGGVAGCPLVSAIMVPAHQSRVPSRTSPTSVTTFSAAAASSSNVAPSTTQGLAEV